MLHLSEILSAVADKLLSVLFFDYKAIISYVIVILLIRTQYIKEIKMQVNSGDDDYEEIYRKRIRRIFTETIFYGAVIGFAAGVLLTSISIKLGIIYNEKTFDYLFIIMVILVLFNIRYVCIAYAGGLLAIADLVFKIPEIDAVPVLIVIAILHVFESLLIFFGAGRNCYPVFIRNGDEIAGAYITRRFWPVPVIFLSLLNQAYWKNALFLNCALSIIAYTDMTMTKQPDKKSREMGMQLLIYACILFVLSIAAVNTYIFGIVGAVFCVAAHEGIMLFSRYRERHGDPIFVSVRRGVRVFDVPAGSHAFKMGMKRGDIILSVNGKSVQTEEGIEEALKNFPTYIWINAVDYKGKEKEYEYRCYPEGINNLGVVIVPRENEVTYNIYHDENYSILKNLVKRFRGSYKEV